MSETPKDIQLRFDGVCVTQLGGAPAEAVIASLNAIQRMVHIIGILSEGRALSERLKPPAKVKREYAVVCRAPKAGSHIQPFTVAAQNGNFNAATIAAREKLLKTLKAFDSGDEREVERVLPNARERWFMAHAALGLLPPDGSELEITVRAGSRGPFTFKADRARKLLQQYETSTRPETDEETIVGRLRNIDFKQTILTVKPSQDPALRMDYPLSLESWLTANARRRLRFVGRPKLNQKGDVSSFQALHTVAELEPTLEPISEFRAGEQIIQTDRPLSIPVTVDWHNRIFQFQDPSLGIDTYAQSYHELRPSLLEDLSFLWRHYALAPDADLDAEAQIVKLALLSRFKAAHS